VTPSAVLRKFRELQRDLLYLKYGDDYLKHEHAPGKFWSEPTNDDAQMMEIIGAYAETGGVPE